MCHNVNHVSDYHANAHMHKLKLWKLIQTKNNFVFTSSNDTKGDIIESRTFISRVEWNENNNFIKLSQYCRVESASGNIYITPQIFQKYPTCFKLNSVLDAKISKMKL